MESFRLENIFNIIKSNCYEAEFFPTEQRRPLLCSPHQSPPGAWAPSPLLHIQSRGSAVGSLPLVFLSYSRANEDIFLCDMIEIYQIFFWNIFTLFTQPKKINKSYSIINMLYKQLWKKIYKQNLKRCRSFISEVFRRFPFSAWTWGFDERQKFSGFNWQKNNFRREQEHSSKTLEIFHWRFQHSCFGGSLFLYWWKICIRMLSPVGFENQN